MTSTPPMHLNPIVVKIGGALLDIPEARSDFLDRFAEAAHSGTPLVLVHDRGCWHRPPPRLGEDDGDSAPGCVTTILRTKVQTSPL